MCLRSLRRARVEKRAAREIGRAKEVGRVEGSKGSGKEEVFEWQASGVLGGNRERYKRCETSAELELVASFLAELTF